MRSVFFDVEAERQRQDEKWGPSEGRPVPTMAVLVEEVGEAAKAILEDDLPGLRDELVQVSAVAAAMVEGIDRGDPPRA